MNLELDVVASPLPDARVRLVAELAVASAGIREGHVGVEFVDARRIAELNERHRGKHGPTDVLSFPLDEDGEAHGPRELGDVVICPEYTVDLEEAVLHGVLHLTGMDHEVDEGEMLTLQGELLRWMR